MAKKWWLTWLGHDRWCPRRSRRRPSRCSPPVSSHPAKLDYFSRRRVRHYASARAAPFKEPCCGHRHLDAGHDLEAGEDEDKEAEELVERQVRLLRRRVHVRVREDENPALEWRAGAGHDPWRCRGKYGGGRCKETRTKPQNCKEPASSLARHRYFNHRAVRGRNAGAAGLRLCCGNEPGSWC